MERLLKDAEALSGVEYNIDNLADVYEAVHVIQNELGITGTTALEAGETVAGSAAAMKAAFKDVLGNLAIGQNVKESMENLAQTISTFLFDNLIPMVMQVLQGLPEGLMAFLDTMVPLLLQKGLELIQTLGQGMSGEFPNLFAKVGEIISGIVSWIQNSLPELLQAGVNIISNIASGFLEGLPQIIEGAGSIISGLLEALLSALPQLAEAGLQIIASLASALMDNAPQILTAIGTVVLDLLAKIIELLPKFIEKGTEMVGNMIQGVTTKAPEIVAKILELVTSLVTKIVEKLPEFQGKGKEIIIKMIEGITTTTANILTALGTLLTELVKAIVNKLPEFLAKGKEVITNMIKGINERKREVVSTINEVIQGALNKVGEWFNKFKEAGGKLVGMIADGIRGAIGKVTSAIGSVVKSIRDFLPFSPAKEGPLKDLHKLDFSIIADGIYKAKNPIQKATRALAQSVKDGLIPTNQIFDELQNQNYESLIGYEVTSKLNDASLTDSEVSDLRPIDLKLNIGGQAFKGFVDKVTLEQDRETNLELAY